MKSDKSPESPSLELISIATAAAAGRSLDMYNTIITEFLNITNKSYSSSFLVTTDYKTIIDGKVFPAHHPGPPFPNLQHVQMNPKLRNYSNHDQHLLLRQPNK